MDVSKKIFLIGLFLMPFFQGLYFYHQTFIVAALLLIFLMVITREQKGLYIERGTITLFLISLFLLYLLTGLYGIDRGMSFIGALKVLTYFIFYLLYTQLYTDAFKEQLLSTLIYSALMAAVLGILALFVPFLSELLIQNGRLGGVFQYANTYGLYCLVCILLVIRRGDKSLFQVWSIAILVIATILTFSRSILVMGLIVVFVGILFERKHVFYHILGVFSGSLVAGILIKGLNLNEVSARLADTSMKTSEWVIRLVYYKDALKMIAQFPFGTGFTGYSFIERTYQTSSTYQVKFVHSNLIQYALDIGILGVILCCLFFIIQFFFRKMDPLLKLAFLTIALHGVIDFDFEFPYILVILLLLLGINVNKVIYLQRWSVVKMSLMAGVLCVYLYMIVPTALAYEGRYEEATYLYPIYTEAQIKELTHLNPFSEQGAAIARKLIQQNHYCVEAFAYLRDYYFMKKSYNQAKAFAEKTIGLNPLNIKHVEIYSTILIECSKEAIGNGDNQTANNHLELLSGIPLYLEKLAKERVTDYNIRHAPRLEMTDELRINEDKGNQLYIELDQ